MAVFIINLTFEDNGDKARLQKNIDWLGSWASNCRKWGSSLSNITYYNLLGNVSKRPTDSAYTLEGTVLENMEGIKYLYSWSQMEQTCQ